MLFVLAYLYTITLLFLPLELLVDHIVLPGGLTPYFSTLLLIAVLGTFYVFIFFARSYRLSFRIVRFAGFLTVLLFLVSVFGSAGFNSRVFLVLILLTWSLPLLDFFVRKFGVGFVGVTVLSVLGLHAQLGIAQFLLQGDVGLHLLGESVISADLSGVAKFSLLGTKVVRAYGPYVHPNNFAGSMLIGGIVLLITLSSFLRRSWSRSMHLFFVSFGFLLLLSALLSFSRSALIGALILLIGALLFFARKSGMFHVFSVKHKYWLILVGTLLVFIPFFLIRSVDPESVALRERMLGVAWSAGVFDTLGSYVHGVGPGNYEKALLSYLNSEGVRYDSWQIAPVHSAPILLALEWGLSLSFVLLIVVLTWMYAGASKPQKLILTLLILCLLPPFLLDHYFVTDPAAVFLLLTLLVLVSHFRLPVELSEEGHRT